METPEEKKSCEPKKTCCLCRKLPAVFVILIGVTGLLRALDVLGPRHFKIAIAVLVILAGLQMLCQGMCNCCGKSNDGECGKK